MRPLKDHSSAPDAASLLPRHSRQSPTSPRRSSLLASHSRVFFYVCTAMGLVSTVLLYISYPSFLLTGARIKMSTPVSVSYNLNDMTDDVTSHPSVLDSLSSLDSLTALRALSNHEACRYYLAESAIPQGGWGLYTAVDVANGEEAQPMPDICIYLGDAPKHTSLDSHTWGRDVFMGSFEGRRPRGACEGFGTL
jgi:hypothetical protein